MNVQAFIDAATQPKKSRRATILRTYNQYQAFLKMYENSTNRQTPSRNS